MQESPHIIETDQDYPYFDFKPKFSVIILRVAIIMGISVFITHYPSPDEEGMHRMHFWFYHEKNWYGDYVTILPDAIANNVLRRHSIESMVRAAELTIKKLIKTS